jgi:hypothetical protein
MPEGLSASEVGKEIGQHAEHGSEHASGRTRAISITEAILLSVVAILAAWSGYSAAKWGTESSLTLAKASATRTKANRAFQQSLSLRTADAVTFNAWFGAYIAGNKNGARVAAKRFRPQYAVAFRAWLATDPFTNPKAPPGPQQMPQYHPTGAVISQQLDTQADDLYSEGEHDAQTGDKYVRATVILASVLFLVGISTHFPLPGVRIGLITVATALLIFGVIEILQLPGPPS